MSYHRVIFRLDYEPKFEMFDSFGKTMSLLLGESFKQEKFLPDLLENKQGHGVAANYVSPTKSETRMLTVEPVSIYGSFEVVEGVTSTDIEEYAVFRKLIKLVNEARNTYHISMLKRCGLRLYHLDNVPCKEEFLRKFNCVLDQKFLLDVESTLGQVADTGIRFDGENADGTKYHFMCGPYASKEAGKYFPVTHSLLEGVADYNLILDIDLYEIDFTLDYRVSFAKWCNSAISKANDIIKLIRKNLS